MGKDSKIEWCDHTLNPWIGCTEVSTEASGGGGCTNCYARELDARYRYGGATHWGAGVPRYRTSKSTWAQALTWNRAHDAFFAQHGRRQRVFCASLADIFDNEVLNTWRSDLIGLVYDTPNLDWLWLTKRIGNVSRLMEWKMPPNVWLGVTVVNQMEADRDVPKLLAIPARVRFLSCEPLLGPINLTAHCPPHYAPHLRADRIGWVISGGESGPKARPSRPDWHRSLRDQCAAAGVPFLFKQWGEWAPYDRGGIDSRVIVTPGALDTPLSRFGKKATGRMLDGRTHDQFPETNESRMKALIAEWHFTFGKIDVSGKCA